MGVRAQINVRDLRSGYDAYAPYILQLHGYIKELPRKRKKYRRYRILKDLPSFDQYKYLMKEKFSYTMAEFISSIHSEIRGLLADCLHQENRAIDWMNPVHRENNQDAIDILTDVSDRLLGMLVSEETHEFKEPLASFFTGKNIVYVPAVDYTNWMIGRKTNKNAILAGIVDMIDRVITWVYHNSTVVNREQQEVMYAFLRNMQEFSGLLSRVRFTAFSNY